MNDVLGMQKVYAYSGPIKDYKLLKALLALLEFIAD